MSHYTYLKHESLLHIVGPDTLQFLQGQTTCDTRKVDSSHALQGVFCTPQGRVVCDFLLCELDHEHYAMRMRSDICESSSAAFGKYIIFSKATLDAEREDWATIALWGPQAAGAIRNIFGETPAEQYGARSGTGFVVVQIDTSGEQFECYVNTTSNQEQLNNISKELEEGSEPEWQGLQIATGIARIEANTVEEFVPQTLNFDLTSHISFNKGCYTGQEVVARLHYLGKPKRRTYLAELSEVAECEPGSILYEAGADKSAGAVVNCCTTADGIRALIAVTTKSIANGLHLGEPGGPLLTVVEPPYALGLD